jgi:hypothetical protein
VAERLVPGHTLVDLLGQGGMAEVWRAVEDATGAVVAVKLLSPAVARDPELVAMFLDEARLGRELVHPNIVRCLGEGLALDGRPYLCLEYVDGLDLREVLTRAARARMWLPLDFSLTAVLAVARALDHAHWARDAHGEPLHVVHRDVSHSNVFLSAGGDVKLADFGIARARGRNVGTHEGLVKGKLGYLAPEQIRAEPLDARADVFAACVVLWELLTQRRLFVAETEFKTMMLVTQGERVPPSSLRAGLPLELDGLVLPGLAHAAADRYPSAGVLADAIERTAARIGVRLGPAAIASVLAVLGDGLTFDETPQPAVAPRVVERLVEHEPAATRPGEIVLSDDALVIEPPSETFAVSTHDLDLPGPEAPRDTPLPPRAARQAVALAPLARPSLELHAEGQVLRLDTLHALVHALAAVRDARATLTLDRRGTLSARDARELLEIDPEPDDAAARLERVRGIEATVVLGELARRGRDGWLEVRRGPHRLRAIVRGGRLVRVRSDAAEHQLLPALAARHADPPRELAQLLAECLAERRPLRAVARARAAARDRAARADDEIDVLARELDLERLGDLLALAPIHLAVRAEGGGPRGVLPELAEAIERAWSAAEVDAELRAFDARVPLIVTLPTHVLAPGLLAGTELVDGQITLGEVRERATAATRARLLALLALGELRLR